MVLPLGAAAQTPVSDYARFPVTFDPLRPQAFQPFTVNFLAYSDKSRPISIQVDGNVIVIDIVGVTSVFAAGVPPRHKVQATIDGIAPGDYVVKVFDNVSPDYRGRHRVQSLETEPDWPLSISEAPSSVPIHAFYNQVDDHYFITASSTERKRIMEGSAGYGWIIVGENFQVWPADGPAPDAARAVCRFYSASANSHFYTVEGAECEALRQPGSGWAYEGIAFRTLVAKAGSCPQGTDPVWRLYNNRAAENDSNHRFTASTVDYRSMIESGWIGEGAVFCSPR